MKSKISKLRKKTENSKKLYELMQDVYEMDEAGIYDFAAIKQRDAFFAFEQWINELEVNKHLRNQLSYVKKELKKLKKALN